MNKILIIGETPLVYTRFGTTIREIGSILKDSGFEVACMGFNYSGWPFQNDKVRYPLYPWIGHPDDSAMIRRVLQEYKPDTLLLIGPSFLFNWLKKFDDRDRYRIILHTVFKSLPLNKEIQEIFHLANLIVVNSLYEKTALETALPESHIRCIPPGIDTNELKSVGELGINDGRFRVGCTVKDIPQVDIPTLLKAFGIVAEAEPSITFGLFADIAQLHTWGISDMVDVYNLQDRCSIVNPQPESNFGLPSMGGLYSSMDLFVSLHQEENVNVSALEARYCNVPMLLPQGGATEEYLDDRVIFLENSDFFVAPPHNTRYRVFDSEEVAEKIIQFFKRNKTKTQRRPCPNVLQDIDWNTIGREWIKLMI